MTRTSSRRRRLVVFGVICCAVMVVSCSTPPASPPDRDRPPAGRLKDRDQRAVFDALRRLDMCALLATVVSDDSSLSSLDPSSCISPELRVAEAEFSYDDRLSRPTRTVGGAKAYFEDANQC